MLRNQQDPNFPVDAIRRNRRLKRLPNRLPSRQHQKFLENWKAKVADEPEGRDILGKRARTEAWKVFRDSWGSAQRRNYEVKDCDHSKIPKSIERLGDLDNTETKARIMMRYDPNRKFIHEEASNPDYTFRTSSALQTMIRLCRRDYVHPALFYPGEEPRKSTTANQECWMCIHSLDKFVQSHYQCLQLFISFIDHP